MPMNGKRITRENVQKKKKKILKVFFCIIIFIVLMISALIANEYIILDKNKTMNLVINNKNVTANLKKDIIIEIKYKYYQQNPYNIKISKRIIYINQKFICLIMIF